MEASKGRGAIGLCSDDCRESDDGTAGACREKDADDGPPADIVSIPGDAPDVSSVISRMKEVTERVSLGGSTCPSRDATRLSDGGAAGLSAMFCQLPRWCEVRGCTRL